LTDGHKKAMDRKKKVAKMASRKAAYDASRYPTELACPYHGFVNIDCQFCISNLKKRLGQAPAQKPPEE